MKLHYKGKYDLNPESLPHGIHQPGAVPFKEAKDSKTLSLIASILSLIILILLTIILYLRCRNNFFSLQLLIGCYLSILVFIPHEFLHAICFKDDVYLYTNLKQGMFFVIGPETMSRERFIFMSMLPNLVFGFIPYMIALFQPSFILLGSFGALSVAMGAGDYYNVYNAVTQMPRGTRTYLYQFNSFWYYPS